MHRKKSESISALTWINKKDKDKATLTRSLWLLPSTRPCLKRAAAAGSRDRALEAEVGGMLGTLGLLSILGEVMTNELSLS